MALCARIYDVSEKINQTRTKRTNTYLREVLGARKCLLRLDARKFSCAKISTFTVGPYWLSVCLRSEQQVWYGTGVHHLDAQGGLNHVHSVMTKVVKENLEDGY